MHDHVGRDLQVDARSSDRRTHSNNRGSRKPGVVQRESRAGWHRGQGTAMPTAPGEHHSTCLKEKLALNFPKHHPITVMEEWYHCFAAAVWHELRVHLLLSFCRAGAAESGPTPRAGRGRLRPAFESKLVIAAHDDDRRGSRLAALHVQEVPLRVCRSSATASGSRT